MKSILGPRGLALDASELAQPLVVAVSGGLDSVVLLDCLVKHPRRTGALTIAHVNYRLRPDADADAASVRALATQYGIPCRILTVRTRPPATQRQVWARDVRYRFFARVARAVRAPAVVTAHHADDQVETVLMHLCRGSGVTGMAGMTRVRPLTPTIQLLRPLLGFFRAQIARYAERSRLTWREDASNQDLHYTRNRVRQQVVPLLESIHPHAAAHIAELAARLQEAETALAAWTATAVAQIPVVARKNSLHADRRALFPYPAIIQKRILCAWYQRLVPHHTLAADHQEQMRAVVQGRSVHCALPGPAHLSRAGTALQLARGSLRASRPHAKRRSHKE